MFGVNSLIRATGLRSGVWRGGLCAPFCKSPFDQKHWAPTAEDSAGIEVSRNVGLSRFLSKTYNWTGAAVGGALLSSQVAMAMCSPAAYGALTIAGLICGLGGLIGASRMAPQPYTAFIQLGDKKATTLATQNSPLRKLLFGLGVCGIGISSTPLMAFAAAVNPSAIPMALGLTMALFGGASLAAYRMPKDKMLSYGRPLMGSLIGLIALQISGFLATLAFGPNPFSIMIMRADAYVATGLFTALIAYDTHVAIKLYEDGNADHLGVSISLFLDFWNIFQSLLHIFSSRD